MIGVIGAMEQEVEHLRSLLEGSRTEVVGGFAYHAGRLSGAEVVLLKCGIGKVNSAVGCALLLEKYRPTAIVNTGSAGGLLPSQAVGDVVVSDAALYHDVDVTAFGYAKGQVPGQPASFGADPVLARAAERALDALQARGELPASLRHTRGVVGSGDVFVHDPDLVASIRRAFPELCAVEMESASIAHACALFGTPFVIVRALSDIAGKESPMSFDEFLPVASRHSSLLVLEMLKGVR